MWPSSKRDARRREDDPDVWGALYERFHPGEEGDAGVGRPGRSPVSADSKARLLEAAIGIVGSVRVFFEVAEDVLLDQRERVHQPRAREEPTAASPQGPPREATRPPVQDIPMEHP